MIWNENVPRGLLCLKALFPVGELFEKNEEIQNF